VLTPLQPERHAALVLHKPRRVHHPACTHFDPSYSENQDWSSLQSELSLRVISLAVKEGQVPISQREESF